MDEKPMLKPGDYVKIALEGKAVSARLLSPDSTGVWNARNPYTARVYLEVPPKDITPDPDFKLDPARMPLPPVRAIQEPEKEPVAYTPKRKRVRSKPIVLPSDGKAILEMAGEGTGVVKIYQDYGRLNGYSAKLISEYLKDNGIKVRKGRERTLPAGIAPEHAEHILSLARSGMGVTKIHTAYGKSLGYYPPIISKYLKSQGFEIKRGRKK